MKTRFQNLALVLLLTGVFFVRVMGRAYAVDSAERSAWIQERLWDAKFLASRKQKAEAAAIYFELAEAGDAEAMGELGMSIILGAALEEVNEEGERLLLLAGEAGRLEYWDRLANLYFSGEAEFPKDEEKARELAERAIAAGYFDAYATLADSLEDKSEAVRFLLTGSDRGSVKCRLAAYRLYRDGADGFPGDAGLALKYLRLAADTGYGGIGAMVKEFLSGGEEIGLTADMVHPYAEKLEKEALTTNNPSFAEHFLLLSDLYREGKVFARDPARADFWLNHALGLGGGDVYHAVGARLLREANTEREAEEAMKYLDKAGVYGNVEAAMLAIEAYAKGDKVAVDWNKSFEWFDKWALALGGHARVEVYRQLSQWFAADSPLEDLEKSALYDARASEAYLEALEERAGYLGLAKKASILSAPTTVAASGAPVAGVGAGGGEGGAGPIVASDGDEVEDSDIPDLYPDRRGAPLARVNPGDVEEVAAVPFDEEKLPEPASDEIGIQVAYLEAMLEDFETRPADFKIAADGEVDFEAAMAAFRDMPALPDILQQAKLEMMAPAIDPEDFDEIRWRGSVSAARGAARELAGILPEAEEKEFNRRWDKMLDYPAPECIEYVNAILPILSEILSLRGAGARVMMNYDSALSSAALARDIGQHETAHHLMFAVGQQAALLLGIEESLVDALARLEALGEPPDPEELKGRAKRGYREALAEFAPAEKLPPPETLKGKYVLYSQYTIQNRVLFERSGGGENRQFQAITRPRDLRPDYRLVGQTPYTYNIRRIGGIHGPSEEDFAYILPGESFSDGRVSIWFGMEQSRYFGIDTIVCDIDDHGTMTAYHDLSSQNATLYQIANIAKRSITPTDEGFMLVDICVYPFEEDAQLDKDKWRALVDKAQEGTVPENMYRLGVEVREYRLVDKDFEHPEMASKRKYGKTPSELHKEHERRARTFEAFETASFPITTPLVFDPNGICWVLTGVEYKLHQYGPDSLHFPIFPGHKEYFERRKKEEPGKRFSIANQSTNYLTVSPNRVTLRIEGDISLTDQRKNKIEDIDAVRAEQRYSFDAPPTVVQPWQLYNVPVSVSTEVGSRIASPPADHSLFNYPDIKMRWHFANTLEELNLKTTDRWSETGVSEFESEARKLKTFGREDNTDFPKSVSRAEESLLFDAHIMSEYMRITFQFPNPTVFGYRSFVKDAALPLASYTYRRVFLNPEDIPALENDIAAIVRGNDDPQTLNRDLTQRLGKITGSETLGSGAVIAENDEERIENLQLADATAEQREFHENNIRYIEDRIKRLEEDIARERSNPSPNSEERLRALSLGVITARSDAIYEQDRIRALETGEFTASRTPFDDYCRITFRKNIEDNVNNIEAVQRQQNMAEKLLEYIPYADREPYERLVNDTTNKATLDLAEWKKTTDILRGAMDAANLREQAAHDLRIGQLDAIVKTAETAKAIADTGILLGSSMAGGPMGLGMAYSFVSGTVSGGVLQGAKEAVSLYSGAARVGFAVYDGYRQDGWEGAAKHGGKAAVVTYGLSLLSKAKAVAPNLGRVNARDIRTFTRATPPIGRADIAAYNRELGEAQQHLRTFTQNLHRLRTAQRAGASAADIARLQTSVTRSTAAINQSPAAKAILKFDKNRQSLARLYDRELGRVHQDVLQLYRTDMTSRGLGNHQIRPIRNAASTTTGMDSDWGIVQQRTWDAAKRRYVVDQSFIRTTPGAGPVFATRVNVHTLQVEGQDALNRAYSQVTGGYSATRSWEHLTSSAHPEAYREMSLLAVRCDGSGVSRAMGNLSRETARQATDVTMYKTAEMLNQGGHSRLMGIREACRGINKDVDGKMLPIVRNRIDTLRAASGRTPTPAQARELERLGRVQDRMETIVDSFGQIGRGDIPPERWDDTIRLATGDRGIMETINDLSDLLTNLF